MKAEKSNMRQRRAMNLIWMAAGEYAFPPLFLAFAPDGAPDFYMNCIIGLVHKWYGDAMPRALFACWAGDRRQPMFDELAWLALENAALEKELPQRPVLTELRKAHAADFFAQESMLSRQQWMTKNQLVYALQSARWRRVLGQKPPLLTLREKQLDAALCCRGCLSSEQLAAAIRQLLAQFFGFDGSVQVKQPLGIHFSEKWAPLLTKLLPVEIIRTDELSISHAGGVAQEGTLIKAAGAVRSRLHLNENAETDREYIENCFGRSLYAPDVMAAMEQQLCTGNHFGCHLWVTAGVPSAVSRKSAESRRLAQQAVEQQQKNEAAFARDRDLYQSAILRLTHQIRNAMLVHQQPQAEPARLGRLDGGRVWRAAVLADGCVFHRTAEENRPGFSVQLLVDASASRLHCQETIAAQGYILAESLQRCGIPVQVASFCSLRGYTVLHVLKSYAEHAGARKIFSYFAAGWNRDGLALRGVGRLLEEAPGEKHLLILLTDASPNDSHTIPITAHSPFPRSYDGDAGVQDTAAEVRALRRSGVRAAAVFWGENGSIPAAELIFGHELARIHRIDQLADAAGKLIRSEIDALMGG